MTCPNCNNQLEEGTVFCTACGVTVDNSKTVSNQQASSYNSEPRIPSEYTPLGAWAYFWLSVLYFIPVIGWIFNIVFCFASSNHNLKNFSRSFWCPVLIMTIIAVVTLLIVLVIALITGISISSMLESAQY